MATKDNRNSLIAEFTGFKTRKASWWERLLGSGKILFTYPDGRIMKVLPNFENDARWMDLFITCLPEFIHNQYLRCLFNVLSDEGPPTLFGMTNATSQQKAKAFVELMTVHTHPTL